MPRNLTIRKLRKTFHRIFTKKHAFVIFSVTLIGALAIYGIIQQRIMINPIAYTPLLNVIAEGESRGNYNAHFGNAANQKIIFTSMSLAEVLAWQTAYLKQNNASSAVGRYQIIQPTLEGLIEEYSLDTGLIFNKELQDKLAIALMERRGAIDFIRGKVSKEEFAHNLSKEWAALPRVIGDAPNDSFYAGDGLNRALISRKQILEAIEVFQQRAQE
jgi:conjugal transfer mating pair stabilization protein TraG